MRKYWKKQMSEFKTEKCEDSKKEDKQESKQESKQEGKRKKAGKIRIWKAVD